MKIDLFGLPTKTIVFLLGFATCNMGCSDEVVIKEDVYVKDTEGVFPDYGEVLAFPGAEGYGRKTTGGRGGEVSCAARSVAATSFSRYFFVSTNSKL